MNDNSEREALKKSILALGIFNKDNKFNRYKPIPEEIKQACFDLTPKCISLELKDRLYWILNDIHDYAFCATCSTQIVRSVINFKSNFKNQAYCNASCRFKDKTLREAYDQERLERTGYRSPLQDPAIRARLVATNLQKYGVKYAAQAPSVKEKIKKTVKEKYNADWISQVSHVKEAKIKTSLKRYGVEHPMQQPDIREKASSTCLQKYGVENPRQVEEFNDQRENTNLERYGSKNPGHTRKGRLTCIKKYGVRNPMQNLLIFQKQQRSAFKLKNYTAPDGSIIRYQGYEDVALKFLLEDLKLPSEAIIVSHSAMPKITYWNSTKNKMCRYYPDIYIEAIKTFFEVKSIFTYSEFKQETHEKQDACIKLGFEHLILVCNKLQIINII